jgi:hypothetical protein
VRDKNIKRAVQKVVDSFVDNFKATSNDKLQLTLHYDKSNELELQSAHKTVEKLNDTGFLFTKDSVKGKKTLYKTTRHNIKAEMKKVCLLLDFLPISLNLRLAVNHRILSRC